MLEFTSRGPRAAAALLCSSLSMTTGVLAQGFAGSAAIGSLPRDLTAWGMFRDADVVVKLVIIGLALASLLTWTIAIAKAREIWTSRQLLARDIRALEAATSLAAVGALADPIAQFVEAAISECGSAPDLNDADAIKERIASRLGRIEAAFGRAMIRGTGLLATIGATAPFVGLFGTVWGIMTSFIGISKQQTTNLAVVAPGIAEALLATAAGLVVAIPAVVIYNAFSRSIGTNRAMCADAAAAVMRLASRDLSVGGARAPVKEGALAVVPRQRP